MTTTLEATVDSLQDVLAGVYRGIEETIQELAYEPVWDQVIADLEALHLQYFRSETSPSGEPWAELAESTVRAKGHAGILWERTRLMSSLLDVAAAGAIREVYDEPGNSGFSFGTDVEYAKFHMTGTSSMPARVFLGINDPEVDAIVERLLDYAVRGLEDGI